MNRTQPIRKPKNRRKFELNQHRRRARAIHARIIQKDGKLYLFSCAPVLANLEAAFATIKAEHLIVDVALADIAFAGTCDGQLTRGVLNEINQSLESWRKFLDRNDRDSSLDVERTELCLLRERVDLCFGLLNGTQSETSLILSNTQICEFNNNVGKTNRLSAYEQKLAKLVYWHSGHRATERFVHILSNIVFVDQDKLTRIDKSIAWLNSLRQRSTSEPEWLLRYEIRRNAAFQELVEWIRKKQLPWQKVKGSLSERLERYINNLLRSRRLINDFVDHFFAKTVAAWAICDRGTVNLPLPEIAVIHNALDPKWLVNSARNYVSVSQRPGYDKLLQLVNEQHLTGRFKKKRAALDLLDQGWSIDDIKRLGAAIAPARIGTEVEPARLCQLVSLYIQVMGTLRGETIPCLQGYHLSPQRVDVLLMLFRWLARFPKNSITTVVKGIVVNLVEELITTFDCDIFRPAVELRLQQWSNLRAPTRTADELESEWPPNSKRWLRRLSHFRKLAGQDAQLPKSLRRRFRMFEKRANEIAFLETRAEQGKISGTQHARLEYLNACENRAPSSGATLRTTREACLFAGLDAFRNVFHETAREIWKNQTGCEINDWSISRCITMARWVAKMSPRERNLVRQTTAAWQKHGAKYKLHLAFNERWIRKAHKLKVKLRHWLCPTPYSAFVDGRFIILRTAKDPIEIYLMGSYFNTCLSQGGCNEMSVLANAAHMNKQVVYAFAEDETVIGRQLVAINSEFQLVGFHNYVNCDGVFQAKREEMIKHFAKFAGRIAVESNVAIAGEKSMSTVDNLGGHFWYDDGVHPWHDAIHEA